MATFFVLADSLLTDSCLNHSARGWAPLYNGNGQLKHVSDCQNNLLTMASIFSDWSKVKNQVMKFDPYGALMIN